jgi:hypothetical protein
VLALRYIRSFDTPAPPRFDFQGFLIVGIGLALLELAIEYLGRGMVPVSLEIGLFVAAAVMLGFYGWYATRRADPVIDLTLFRLNSFRISTLAGGLCRLSIAAVPFMLPLQLQLGFGLDPLHSGFLTFITSIGAMAMKTIIGRVVRLVGFRNLLAWNGVLLGLTICGLGAFTAETPHWLLLGYLLAYGFVRSVQFTSVTALGYADLTPAIMSKGTSVSAVTQQLCNSFGVAIAATVLTLLVGPDQQVEADDFRLVFVIIGLFPLLALPSFLRLRPQDGAALNA